MADHWRAQTQRRLQDWLGQWLQHRWLSRAQNPVWNCSPPSQRRFQAAPSHLLGWKGLQWLIFTSWRLAVKLGVMPGLEPCLSHADSISISLDKDTLQQPNRSMSR